MNPTLKAYFSALGKASRAKQLAASTPEQRTEQAKRAAVARWQKTRKEKQ